MHSLYQITKRCTMFGWNWLSGSGEEDLFYLFNVFLLCIHHFPLENDMTLHLKNLNSFKLTQGCFVSSLFEICLVNKKISSMYFRYDVIIVPCDIPGPSTWTNLNSHHPKILCARFIETDPVVLEKKTKVWKVYDNKRQQYRRQWTTDKFRSKHLTWAFGSGEL